MTWQPIETAPKDILKPVLLWTDSGLFLGFRFPGFAQVRDRWVQADVLDEVYPTHWMPLPEPPEEG